MRDLSKRQKQNKSFPWRLMAVGGILLILAAFFFTKQGGAKMPSIAVDQQTIDFGDQKFGTNLTFVIQVTNTGTGTLRFEENPYIEVVQGC